MVTRATKTAVDMKSGVKYTIELIKVGRRQKKRKMAIRASMM
jgi:hypothetical protein